MDSLRSRMHANAKRAELVRLISRLNHAEQIDIPSWCVEPPSLYEPGWYLRSDIIWHKPNPMPESVTDRPTKAHEYIFLLAKQERYVWDAEAVREDGPTYTRKAGGYAGRNGDNASRFAGKGGFGDSNVTTTGRNSRTVWTITTEPFAGAHFATFPVELAKRCIEAGSRVGDIVLDPFVGSGTTIVAALALRRRAVGLDLSRPYLNIASRRIEHPHKPVRQAGARGASPIVRSARRRGLMLIIYLIPRISQHTIDFSVLQCRM